MTLVTRVNPEELWNYYLTEAGRMRNMVILPKDEAKRILELVEAELNEGRATETQWLLCLLVANAGYVSLELEGNETTKMASEMWRARVARARKWLEERTEWTLVASRGGGSTHMLPIYQMARKEALGK